MNRPYIHLCFLFCFGLSFAQSETQLILGIADFTANTEQQEQFAGVLKERVIDLLNQTGRFKLVDIEGSARQQSIDKAAENYKSNWIEGNKSINAEHTLTAFIGNIKFLKLNGGKGYKATITYTIKILNTESGKYINNGTLTLSSSESDIKLTPETALQNAIDTTSEEFKTYIKNSFPIKVSIAKIEEEKKGKALIIILNGGTENGIKKGQVYTSKFIDYSMGSPYPVSIGKVKITEVVNEKFSKAKVIKGGEEILKHFTASDKIINELEN
ncbi:hypothetical protein [Winogradskyella helgolandensis]|uniref:hypothetical protein n=1 Tax=Winogradskyella helgolandensis TaxID=2697010 RepID=UPI0015C76786|nr:hypothetical protein [Winogradskyella helgolandensis]